MREKFNKKNRMEKQKLISSKLFYVKKEFLVKLLNLKMLKVLYNEK